MTESATPAGVKGEVVAILHRLAHAPDRNGLRELDGLIRRLGKHGLAEAHRRLELAGLTGAHSVHALFGLLRDPLLLREMLGPSEGSSRPMETLLLRLQAYGAWLVAIGLAPYDGPSVPSELATLRSLLAPLHARPWGDQDHLIARSIDVLGIQADEVRRIQEICKEIAISNERKAVTGRVRAYVARSGLTQRQFATRIGTSPSRLSAYVNGGTVPSAAMMLRMQRVAGRAETHSIAG